MALGLTMQLPLDDKLSHDKNYLETRLAILMAGRIAEEIFLNQMTTGAGNDIERATEMAHKMVCEWGMSELGPLSFGKKDEQIFLGREIAQHRDYSEETAIKIDAQVQKLVVDGYNRARRVIEDRSDALVRIAEALLEREVLEGAEVMDLINGKTLPKLAAVPKTNPTDGGTAQPVIAPQPQTGMPGLMGGESPQPA
jgi:cell division protease FtsH